MQFTILIMALLSFLWGKEPKMDQEQIDNTTIYDFTMKSLEGEEIPLSQYEGKVVIIVNTASKCGLTPQYESLEKYYGENKERGVVILGFPANNFMKQEPGSDEEIASFCQKNYGVSFPMFSKISVKGKDQDPLYQYLTSATGETVKWNFQKYIIGKDGKVITAISPKQTIDDPKTTAIIEEALSE